MKEYAIVKTNIWRDANFQVMSPEQKLITLYLLTCQDNNWSGIFKLHIPNMAYDIGMKQDNAQNAFEAIMKQFSGLYAYDYDTGEVAILNWGKMALQHASDSSLLAANKALKEVVSTELLKKMITATIYSKHKEMYIKAFQSLNMRKRNAEKEIEALSAEMPIVASNCTDNQAVNLHSNIDSDIDSNIDSNINSSNDTEQKIERKIKEDFTTTTSFFLKKNETSFVVEETYEVKKVRHLRLHHLKGIDFNLSTFSSLYTNYRHKWAPGENIWQWNESSREDLLRLVNKLAEYLKSVGEEVTHKRLEQACEGYFQRALPIIDYFNLQTLIAQFSPIRLGQYKKSQEKTKKKFPNKWDTQFESTLSPNEVIEYKKHLLTLGFIKERYQGHETYVMPQVATLARKMKIV